MPLFVPPLRDRKHDIIILAEFFLHKYNKITKNEFKGFADETIRIMKGYDWPGNVRELENAIQYAVNVEKEKMILPFQDNIITDHVEDIIYKNGQYKIKTKKNSFESKNISSIVSSEQCQQ